MKHYIYFLMECFHFIKYVLNYFRILKIIKKLKNLRQFKIF